MEKVIINNESIYLKKSFDGWRVIHPWKNDDGSKNWNNIFIGGSWWNLVKVIILVLMILGITLSYKHDIKEYRAIANYAVRNPCIWCDIMRGNVIPDIDIPDINWSKIVVKSGENGELS